MSSRISAVLAPLVLAPLLTSACLVADPSVEERDPPPPGAEAAAPLTSDHAIIELPADYGERLRSQSTGRKTGPNATPPQSEDSLAASGACQSFDRYGPKPIEVWVHNDVPGALRHADANAPNGQGFAWTRIEVERLILRLISIINDSTGSNHPPLYFRGWTSEENTSANVIKVVVNERSCDWLGDRRPAGQGGIVKVPMWSCGSSPTLELFDRDFGNSQFVGSGGAVFHEFGHALGVLHATNNCRPPCGSGICSVGDADAGKQEHSSFFWDDQLFFRYHYGAYTGGTEHFETSNASSWWPLGESSPPNHQAGAELSGNGEIGPYMFMNLRTAKATHTRQYRWVSGTEAWEYQGESFGQGVGAVGSAYDAATGRAFAVRLSHETSQSSNKRLEWATLPGPYTTDSSGVETERHGVSAAYDPRSEKLIAVTRAQRVNGATAHWQILFHIIDPVTNKVVSTSALGTFDDPVLAFDVPSVTCGNESIYFNCMIAWGTGGDPAHYPNLKQHVLRTMQFRVTSIGRQWVIWKSPYQSPAPKGKNWTAYSRPIVAYKGGGRGSSAFVLAWSVPRKGKLASDQYTVYKSGDHNAAWSTYKYHFPNGKYRHQPVLGAQNGYAELLRDWKP